MQFYQYSNTVLSYSIADLCNYIVYMRQSSSQVCLIYLFSFVYVETFLATFDLNQNRCSMNVYDILKDKCKLRVYYDE